MDIEYLFMTKMRQWVIFIYVYRDVRLDELHRLDNYVYFYTEIAILECCIILFLQCTYYRAPTRPTVYFLTY